MIFIEYTKYPEGQPFADLRMALNERADNFIGATLKETQRRALNRLQNERVLAHFTDYILLQEMAAETRKLWQHGTMFLVYFIGGQKPVNNMVMEIAAEWSQYGNIHFKETNDPNIAKLRVSFEDSGNWSYIGTDALLVPIAKATINLGDVIKQIPISVFKRLVLHEFGHALGLIHEHQSPAAKVQWNRPYIYLYCATKYNWGKDKVDKNIIDSYEETSVRRTALDKDSIMGYYIPPEFTLNNEQYPLNDELSDDDKTFIAELYP